MAAPATASNPLMHPVRDLVGRLHCPSCWHALRPADALFIAEDPRLLGDPVAGADEALRFLPSRFDLTGAALDPEGARCTRLACPRCRREIPRSMLELPATIVSVVGAPGAGKSHLLASAIWSMRRDADRLGLQVIDAEPRLHARLHAWENRLFGSAEGPRRLEKTETSGGQGYASVRIEGRTEVVPAPFVFTLRRAAETTPATSLVLYDNAGEHFLPGADDALRPVTRHLGRSEAIVFVLDPTQDPGFRAAVGLPPSTQPPVRQDLVLSEMAARIRHHRGRRTDERLDVPLVIAMAKADLWAATAHVSMLSDPFAVGGDPVAALRPGHQACLALARRGSPEFVAAFESAFERVLLVPCSGLGRDAAPPEGPVTPRWAAVPFVAACEFGEGGRLGSFKP
ncbi:MAG: hypothetical protein EBQ99_05225 [Planctomycetes bacterium]|nr:hypothetical protein [Planctomycetota bacterium]